MYHLHLQNALYERVYHKSLQKNWNLSFSGTQIVENPEILTAIDEMNEKNLKSNIEVVIPEPQPITKDVSFESPNLNQSILVPVNKQVETRLPSGKRRITPMLLAPAHNVSKEGNTSLL